MSNFIEFLKIVVFGLVRALQNGFPSAAQAI